jgi:predicted ATP-dependent serine protease
MLSIVSSLRQALPRKLIVFGGVGLAGEFARRPAAGALEAAKLGFAGNDPGGEQAGSRMEIIAVRR